MDTYFKFGMAGDTYLGQVLSLKDPNSPAFNKLSAHWKDPSWPLIKEGIKCCFPGVMEKHTTRVYSPSGLLQLFLAQLVYHADFIKQIVAENPSHDFGSLPMIFDRPDLLDALKQNVTLDPSPDMPYTTGIPPHIHHSIQLAKVIDICGEVKDAVQVLDATIKTTRHNSIDEKMRSDGNVNLAILNEALERFRATIMVDLRDILPPAQRAPTGQLALQNESNVDMTTIIRANQTTFQYAGKFW